MANTLKNKYIELHIDLPNENYQFSRFDWTGKIATVKFQDIQVSGVEQTDCENEHYYGKGFYNEFGIDTALGFDETDIGGWFHKIGVGLLRKDDEQYLFSKKYEIKPALFKVTSGLNSIIINCESEPVNGYAYLLKKEIVIEGSNFTIKYYLQNTGQKDIVTNEYVHNFTAINNDSIGENYALKFPFKLKPKKFGETVNPEQKVDIGQNGVKFSGSPKEQFFFSNLSGNDVVEAKWELINLEAQIGISESGDFKTNKINLWGWEHVISPELFFDISVKPGQSVSWVRRYNIFSF